jgi:nucleotide-binding universal stress UspA family protein
MEFKDILLFLDAERESAAATAVAAGLARQHGGRVTGLCRLPLPPIDTADCYAVGVAAVSDVLRHMDHQAEAAAARAKTAFQTAMAANGVETRWTRTDVGELACDSAVRARLADLVVMSRPGGRDNAGQQLAEAVLRAAGTPCLLVPEGAPAVWPFERIALAWNGARQAKRAMTDAMPLLRAARKVDILVVNPPADPDRQAGVADYLGRHGVAARLHGMRRSAEGVAATLIGWCEAHEVELLVMGAFSRSPHAEHWLGGTTWTALTTTSLPLLMSG